MDPKRAAETILKILASFSPTEQEIIRRFYFKGASVNAISQDLGISEDYVRLVKRTVKQRYREELAGEGTKE